MHAYDSCEQKITAFTHIIYDFMNISSVRTDQAESHDTLRPDFSNPPPLLYTDSVCNAFGLHAQE